MKGILAFILVFLMFSYVGVTVAADMDWQESFDRICAITADSEKLTIDELNDLITESEELLARIESSDIPKKKVYLIRLKRCRNFLTFMRDVKLDSK